ncbi:spore coat protein CotF [Caldalkalibacillus uzonensis]|uniref:Spore coat protein CotF n=1 Tax=Caldalkalibacillus uzonensis TaxID=353224 RepID=A0ABU0CNE3_9BACI|nr:spore coat protein [Caldalkalibacillus uzonensis]MDQ0337931.1 spore coat protein CotF [Caldalkalibacillus uzonensis]
MPYGAHEAMEAHEILSDTINMIDHFAMYATQCQDAELVQILNRHIDQAIQHYNNLVEYTHDYSQVPNTATHTRSPVQPGQIHYGLTNPQQKAPQLRMSTMSTQQIAHAVLSAHKNSAKNHMSAALECADPNVRQLMVDGAVACEQAAYEIFRYMNQKGWYQVPTLDNHTAKTMLHSYKAVQQPQPQM